LGVDGWSVCSGVVLFGAGGVVVVVVGRASVWVEVCARVGMSDDRSMCGFVCAKPVR
jgi:hypothetical protein